MSITGVGMGLVLTPVSTDALNRAPAGSYGEVTGVTQTVRNFGARLGLAVLGSVFISQNTDRVETTLTDRGVPASVADRIAHALTTSGGGADAGGAPGQGGPASRAIFDAVQHDVALSTQTIAWAMAGIMAAAFLVALALMPHRPRGRHCARGRADTRARVGAPTRHRSSGDDLQLAGRVVQAAAAVLGDGDDVLDPHPEPAGQVDARLDGEAHARARAAASRPRPGTAARGWSRPIPWPTRWMKYSP